MCLDLIYTFRFRNTYLDIQTRDVRLMRDILSLCYQYYSLNRKCICYFNNLFLWHYGQQHMNTSKTCTNILCINWDANSTKGRPGQDMTMWYDDQSVIILFLHFRSLTDDLSTHVLLLLLFAPVPLLMMMTLGQKLIGKKWHIIMYSVRCGAQYNIIMWSIRVYQFNAPHRTYTQHSTECHGMGNRTPSATA